MSAADATAGVTSAGRQTRAGVRSAGAALAALLLGTALLGAGSPPAVAGSDGGSWCPSAGPTARQVTAVLDALDARIVARSAATGLRTEVSSTRTAASGATTESWWDFEGDPTLARSAWRRSWWVSDADGRPLAERSGRSGQTFVDARKHRRYAEVGEGLEPSLVDEAALAALPARTAWIRTKTKAGRSWPLTGYKPIFRTYAHHVRTDLDDATFTCTVRSSTEATVEIVAASGSARRTLRVDIGTTGRVTQFRILDGSSALLWQGRVSYKKGARHLGLPKPSVTPQTFRAAAVRTLTPQLSGDYVLPDARGAVAAAGTRARRIAVLRSVAAAGNTAFVRDLTRGGEKRVTSRGTKVRGGVRYSVRFGTTVGTVTFTVKGSHVRTRLVLPDLP